MTSGEKMEVDGVDKVDVVDVLKESGLRSPLCLPGPLCPLRPFPSTRSPTIRLQTHPGCDDRKALLQIN